VLRNYEQELKKGGFQILFTCGTTACSPQENGMAAILTWQPWKHSTGPKSASGRARVARNAWAGGSRAAMRLLARRIAALFDRFESDRLRILG
jgi:hypothetical protein